VFCRKDLGIQKVSKSRCKAEGLGKARMFEARHAVTMTGILSDRASHSTIRIEHFSNTRKIL